VKHIDLQFLITFPTITFLKIHSASLTVYVYTLDRPSGVSGHSAGMLMHLKYSLRLLLQWCNAQLSKVSQLLKVQMFDFPDAEFMYI